MLSDSEEEEVLTLPGLQLDLKSQQELIPCLEVCPQRSFNASGRNSFSMNDVSLKGLASTLDSSKPSFNINIESITSEYGHGDRRGDSIRTKSITGQSSIEARSPRSPRYAADPIEYFPDVPLLDFQTYVQQQQNKTEHGFNHYDVEMEVLQRLSAEPAHKEQIFRPPQSVIHARNRYSGILPHKHTRVKLPLYDDADRNTAAPGSDYINASHVVSDHIPRSHQFKYIAASAPLPNCFADFWSMICHENVSLVLMMTQLEEKSKKKADLYWPDSDAPDAVRVCGNYSVAWDTSDVNVPHVQHEANGHAHTRRFLITFTHPVSLQKHTRKLTHVQYLSWPDKLVPDMDSYTQFMQIYRAHRATFQPTQPILVHCSAGIGRTGTFFATDIILDSIADGGNAKTVNVFNIVRHLRQQRPGLVQTCRQYTFISVFIAHCLQESLFKCSIPTLSAS